MSLFTNKCFRQEACISHHSKSLKTSARTRSVIWTLKSPRLRVSLPSAPAKVASDHYSTGRGAWHGWVTPGVGISQSEERGVNTDQSEAGKLHCTLHTSHPGCGRAQMYRQAPVREPGPQAACDEITPPDIPLPPSLTPASSHDNTLMWPGGRNLVTCAHGHSNKHYVVIFSELWQMRRHRLWSINWILWKSLLRSACNVIRMISLPSIFKKPVWGLAPAFWTSV